MNKPQKVELCKNNYMQIGVSVCVEGHWTLRVIVKIFTLILNFVHLSSVLTNGWGVLGFSV